MLSITQDYNSIYCDGLDGFIGIKLDNQRLEMITVIDVSSVYEDKRRMAQKLANQMGTLNHENVLNILRPVKSINTHIPDGLLII